MKRLLSVMLLSLFALSASAEESKNALYDELVNKGTPIPAGPTFKLPAPLFKPGQTPANVEDLLEKASGRVPVEFFKRQSVTAPFSLSIQSIETADEKRCAQLISLNFIAYGKLANVAQTDFRQSADGQG